MPIKDVNNILSSSAAEFTGEAESVENALVEEQTSGFQNVAPRSPEGISQQFLRSRMSVGSSFMQQQLSSRLAERSVEEEQTDSFVESAEAVSQQDNSLSDLSDAINQFAQLILILFGGSSA